METTMTKTDLPQSELETTKSDSGWKTLVRFSWLLIGNIILYFLAFSMLVSKSGKTSDIAYWIIVVTMIGLRLLDIKKFAGETTENLPATMADWRKYSIKLILFSMLGYILVKGLSHLNLF
jgi:hypothetical protein